MASRLPIATSARQWPSLRPPSLQNHPCAPRSEAVGSSGAEMRPLFAEPAVPTGFASAAHRSGSLSACRAGPLFKSCGATAGPCGDRRSDGGRYALPHGCSDLAARVRRPSCAHAGPTDDRSNHSNAWLVQCQWRFTHAYSEVLFQVLQSVAVSSISMTVLVGPTTAWGNDGRARRSIPSWTAERLGPFLTGVSGLTPLATPGPTLGSVRSELLRLRWATIASKPEPSPDAGVSASIDTTPFWRYRRPRGPVAWLLWMPTSS